MDPYARVVVAIDALTNRVRPQILHVTHAKVAAKAHQLIQRRGVPITQT